MGLTPLPLWNSVRVLPVTPPLWLPLLALVVLLAVAGWAVVSASTTVVLVMRHAEAGTEGADPLLSAEGEARAARLAAVFAAAPGLAPDGIIVSEHRRTQETARPLATALGVPVIVVPAEEPAVDSLVSLYGSAGFAERECHDMYGIDFRGNPDLRPILLYEGFVGHPLRKDYPKDRHQPLIPLRDP
jgi:hypothetical protein